MKHYYETIGENWFSYADFYKETIAGISNNSKIVEIGCWKGRSTCCLGVEIINSKKEIKLFCVDNWTYTPSTEQPVSSQEVFNDVHKQFLENIKPFRDIVTVIKKTSSDASKDIENNSIDFIFIDASHKYEDVKNDINCWLPKLSKNGIISGHDYFTYVHPGVKMAVDEVLGNKISLIQEQNIWIYKNI